MRKPIMALAEATELFDLFKRLKASQEGKDPDPNFYSLALTQANPKFAHRWPIVIKTMVLRKQFFSAAFVAYEKFVAGTSPDVLANKHLDMLDPQVKKSREAKEAYKKAVAAAPAEVVKRLETFDIDIEEVKARRAAGEIVEPLTREEVVSRPAAEIAEPPAYDATSSTLLEARLLGRAEFDAQYVYLTLLEAAKKHDSRNWRKMVPMTVRDGLIQEVLQELKATEQENEEARRMAEEKRLEAMEEYRSHLREWVERAGQIDGYERDFSELQKPNAIATGAAGDIVEFRQGA